MKCPKCGFDNPDGTLFCEECDWRVDQPYTPEKKRNPLAFSGVTLVLGIASLALFLADVFEAAIALGIVAMVLGGYSVNLPRYVDDGNKTVCMVLAGLGLLLGIAGFMFGIYGLVV